MEDRFRRHRALFVLMMALAVLGAPVVLAGLDNCQIYQPGSLKPVDSVTSLKVGDRAPDFTLTSLTGKKISLSDYAGRKTVVVSFVPAAWTPVCSDQWPAYNIAEDIFKKNNAALLGVTVDNIPTLFAWTQEMGPLWFSVLSDFWPHGAVASLYGVLRSNGTTERALFVIDRNGLIRYIDIHDINEAPDLEVLAKELEKIK